MVNKKECVECLFTEINILTECRHPNVVKILDASFDGTIIKEQLVTSAHLPNYVEESPAVDEESGNQSLPVQSCNNKPQKKHKAKTHHKSSSQEVNNFNKSPLDPNQICQYQRSPKDYGAEIEEADDFC